MYLRDKFFVHSCHMKGATDLLRINLTDITDVDINLSKVMAFHVTFNPGTKIQYNRGRYDNMLCYIQNGAIHYQTFDEEEFQAKSNDILFMPNRSRYQVYVPKNTSANFVVISLFFDRL